MDVEAIDPQDALIERLYGTYRRLGLPDPDAGPTQVSYFYAIQLGDRVKLGRSVNPAQRARGLQLPDKPAVLVTAPEWIVSEAEAHKRWAHLRMHREWFRSDPGLLEWLTVEVAARVAAKQEIARRLDVLREAMNSPVRPLQALERVERQVAKEWAAREKKRLKLLADECYEREKALGCGLCGEKKTLYDVGLPRHVCGSCRLWHNLSKPEREWQAQREAHELRRQATQAIELYRRRVTALEQIQNQDGD